MNQNLQNILELQTALTQLHEAEQRLHGIPDWMRELHEEHTAQRTEIERLEETAAEAARQRRAAEAAVQDAQEKLKKYQQQINKVSTQREYGALLQEIDTVKGQITTNEEAAFAALDQHEKADKELAALRESFRDIEERYAAEMARWEGEKPGVAAPGGGAQRAGRRPQEGPAARPGRAVRAHPRPLSRRRDGAGAADRAARPEAARVALLGLQLPRAAAGGGRDPQRRHPGPVRLLQAHPLLPEEEQA